jgi:GNAT superfamily N-acetyltransferase
VSQGKDRFEVANQRVTASGSEHSIRAVLPAEAARLARLAETTFRATFASQNSAQDMDLHCQRSYSEPIFARELADSNSGLFVCESAEDWRGYFHLRWHDEVGGEPQRRALEVHRFYVVDAWQGRGVANAMMHFVLEFARSGSASRIWLGVWEHNPRAIRFYERFGFAACGEHVFPLGDDPQRDIIMEITCDPAKAGPVASQPKSAGRPL